MPQKLLPLVIQSQDHIHNRFLQDIVVVQAELLYQRRQELLLEYLIHRDQGCFHFGCLLLFHNRVVDVQFGPCEEDLGEDLSGDSGEDVLLLKDFNDGLGQLFLSLSFAEVFVSV